MSATRGVIVWVPKMEPEIRRARLARLMSVVEGGRMASP